MVPGASVRVNHLQIWLVDRSRPLAALKIASQVTKCHKDGICVLNLHFPQPGLVGYSVIVFQLEIRSLSSARMAESAFDGLSHIYPIR